MPTGTSEKDLESLIVADMLESGWVPGEAKAYDRSYCLDIAHLRAFPEATQPEVAATVELAGDTPLRRTFLARLEKEIGKRGVIHVLRHGVKHGPHDISFFFETPSPGNEKAAELHAGNRFSVTRQLWYSLGETRRALDLVLFINGLPIATFELKNSLTKQTVEDAAVPAGRGGVLPRGRRPPVPAGPGAGGREEGADDPAVQGPGRDEPRAALGDGDEPRVARAAARGAGGRDRRRRDLLPPDGRPGRAAPRVHRAPGTPGLARQSSNGD